VTASTGTIPNPLQFNGRDHDAETGLRYYRARYYDPAIGRFINEDPIGFSGGTNFYAFVHNGPTNMTDPSGLAPEWWDKLKNWWNPPPPTPIHLPMPKPPCSCPLDLNAFVNQMDNQLADGAAPQRHCGAFVRMGLQAGLGETPTPVGNNTLGTPSDAKDFGPFLTDKLGFSDVTDEWNSQPGYGAQPGDIAVFQPANGSNPSGHVEVWDGTQWVSDYKQGAPINDGNYAGTHFFPNLSKYGQQPYRIYHYPCSCN
jgi:RHS repeat-associated protein